LYGVFALNDAGHILVIHQRNGDQWTFSKGLPARGEAGAPLETAIRELREETQLEVDRFLLQQADGTPTSFSSIYPAKGGLKTICIPR